MSSSQSRRSSEDYSGDFELHKGKNKAGAFNKDEDHSHKTRISNGRAIKDKHEDLEISVSDSVSEVPSEPERQLEEPKQEATTLPVQKNTKQTRVDPINSSRSSEISERNQYDPIHFEDLPVSQEVKDLFKYITRFRPQTVELNTQLKPFIPNYIPATGETDAFLKPSRPDNKEESLGLSKIDEPCLNQSDRASLIAEIRAHRPYFGPREVSFIENAEKNPQKIDSWIKKISSMKRQPPAVMYSKPFPNIDDLMQVWPEEIESLLENITLPSEDLDVSAKEFARLCCALVDIPVHEIPVDKNIVESLNAFFTLYVDLRSYLHPNQDNQDFMRETISSH